MESVHIDLITIFKYVSIVTMCILATVMIVVLIVVVLYVSISTKKSERFHIPGTDDSLCTVCQAMCRGYSSGFATDPRGATRPSDAYQQCLKQCGPCEYPTAEYDSYGIYPPPTMGYCK